MRSFNEYMKKAEGVLHNVLGVTPDAGPEDVKQAFRDKAAGASADVLRDLKYARMVLLKKRKEYEEAGDDGWFKDRRRRRINKPQKQSQDARAKLLARALKLNGWQILRTGVTAEGNAWAAAYHRNIEEFDHQDGEILFLIQGDRLVVYYDALLTAGPHDITNPPGEPVSVEMDGPGGLVRAIKSVTGRIASELYSLRRGKMNRYHVPNAFGEE